MPSYFFHLHFDLDSNGVPPPQTGPPHLSDRSPPKEPSPALADDWRYDRCFTQTVTMTNTSTSDSSSRKSDATSSGSITNGISSGPGGQATKGRFEPYGSSSEEDLGWGVIRLYRESEETPGLYDPPRSTPSKKPRTSAGRSRSKDNTSGESEAAFTDEECTTLCILAVPSYTGPSDFLGFVGEKTREDVSHFRMVRTERANRYMVLLKFRSGKRAREWRREWNGKPFDDLQTENLHVVFIRNVLFSGTPPTNNDSFPDMRHDPFTPSITSANNKPTSTKPIASIAASRSSKPVPPPTPSLIELPTCPVCLERMDESTGLLTILCQHVFHCSCLEKWRGSGCPVCRYTQEGKPPGTGSGGIYTGGEDDTGTNECRVCRSEENLWICLICGHVGCGRYDLAHAFAHHESSGHCFAMDMETQRVWDYMRDGYVHRILQDKSDGKFVELDPPDQHHQETDPTTSSSREDMLPQSKLTTLTLEYTSLLTSQLDSQRLYFEDIIARISSKATRATTSADLLATQLSELESRFTALQTAHSTLLPDLERDLARERKRSATASELVRGLQRQLGEEQGMGRGLMERVRDLEGKAEGWGKEREGWEMERREWGVEKRELEDANRDLMMFLEGREKVKELEGTELGEEVKGGFVEVGTAAEGESSGGGGSARGKRKGRGGGGKK